ncbi:MAG: LLM class flavin-dependent oxidoreductase [Actinobacteria bacterium]|nr:LLM class flavin-dependent oxidoreductase [Actinomycetota bacterium]
MKLGFGLITCQRFPGETRSDEELYADALDLADLAEELGFDSVWVSEHHFVDDAYLPSLMPMCAAIAARTSRVEIGTGLLLAPLHEPLRLAEDAAVVDLLSRGRLILGLGLGWRAEEFEALGVPLEERAVRLQDTVAVLRQAWSGAPVTGGELLTYPGVRATPSPARGGPPIWIGALVERAVRRAGRIADGLMATEVTPATLAEQVAWARQERASAGGDPATLAVGLHLPTFPWKGSEEEAWEHVWPFHRYVAWKYDDMDGARGRGGPPPSPPPASREEAASLREGIVLGTPERVAEQVRAFDEAGGGDLHYVARLYWPGMDPALQREVMHLWAEEVAPLLR